jgi:putative transposase
VTKAEDWQWSSLRWFLRPPQLTILHPGPVPRPSEWLTHVNTPQTEAELAALRRCLRRSTPFGSTAWVVPIAARLGLEYTLRPRGSGTARCKDADTMSLFDGAQGRDPDKQ